MTKDDLSRPIMVHCCKDGTITYRTKDQPVFNGRALPVFSVDTEAEAKALQVNLCVLQWGVHPQQKDRPWYRLTKFGPVLEYEHLEEITRILRDEYDKINSRERQQNENSVRSEG